MKLFKILFPSLSMFVLGASSLQAGFPVYPPFTTKGAQFLVFRDSDNEEMIKNCSANSSICARYYVLPDSFRLARNPDNGVKMLTQGIFPGRNRLNHRVVYNLTLEADLSSYEKLRAQLQDVEVTPRAAYYSTKVRPDQVVVSALPAGEMQFIATGLVGDEKDVDIEAVSQEPAEIQEGEAPELDAEEVKERVEQIAKSVYFTEFFAPKWGGDTHSLGQRFSVSLQGPVWNLEPAFKNMFLSDAGNAVIGSISFRFRAMTTPLKMSFKCNLSTFQEVVNSTRKSWQIYRYQSRRQNIERFNNDEWNAIRQALKVEDYCSIHSYQDLTITPDQLMISFRDLLLNRLLDRAFDTVIDASAPKTLNGKDPKYTYYESKSVKDHSAIVDLDLDSKQVIWLSSDVGFEAGDIEEDQLDPNHWTLCSHWERANIRTRSCEAMCQPWLEVYWPLHPKAKTSDYEPGGAAVCVAYEDLFNK